MVECDWYRGDGKAMGNLTLSGSGNCPVAGTGGKDDWIPAGEDPVADQLLIPASPPSIINIGRPWPLVGSGRSVTDHLHGQLLSGPVAF